MRRTVRTEEDRPAIECFSMFEPLQGQSVGFASLVFCQCVWMLDVQGSQIVLGMGVAEQGGFPHVF